MLLNDLSPKNNAKYDKIFIQTEKLPWSNVVSQAISGASKSSFTNIIKQDEYAKSPASINFDKINDLFTKNNVSITQKEVYNLYDKFHTVTNALLTDDNNPYLTVYRKIGLEWILNVGNYHVELFPSSFSSNPDLEWSDLKYQKSIIKIHLKPSIKHLIFTKNTKEQDEIVVTEAFFKVMKVENINDYFIYTCEIYPFDFKQIYESTPNITDLKLADLKIDGLDNFFIKYFFKNIKNLKYVEENPLWNYDDNDNDNDDNDNDNDDNDVKQTQKRVKSNFKSGIDNLIISDLHNYSINQIKILAKYFQINDYENKSLKILINKIAIEIKNEKLL